MNLVDGTLRLALNVRVALEAGQAGAGRGPVPLGAESVQSTGTGSAGIYDLWLGRRRYKVKSSLWPELLTGEHIPQLLIVKNNIASPFELFCCSLKKKNMFPQRRLTGGEPVLGEGVPLVPLITHTEGNVVPHSAVRPSATETRAGVQTLPGDTGKLRVTVRVEDTLRPTVRRRAQHVWQTGTLAPVSYHSRSSCIGTAGVWITRILCLYRLSC